MQVAASPCCVKALPNAIAVVLPYVPGPLLQLLPRCCLPFLPLGHWPSPSEHGSALGFAPPLLLRMVKILELQSFHYVPAHRFVRLTGSSYPHTHSCVSGSRDFSGHAYHGWLPAPCSSYANHPNRAIDGKGTRTPQIRQTCWLLRSLLLHRGGLSPLTPCRFHRRTLLYPWNPDRLAALPNTPASCQILTRAYATTSVYRSQTYSITSSARASNAK